VTRICLVFLDGGLYVHQRDARPTIVGTHTDPLDAWMYWTEGTSPYEAGKPAPETLLLKCCSGGVLSGSGRGVCPSARKLPAAICLVHERPSTIGLRAA
jgi:hypothetical protein